MRRKYFMRGLGLGVIITALIFTISLTIGGNRGGMTDGEIIKRAKELGMVSAENATMSDVKSETNDSKKDDAESDVNNETETNGSESDNPDNASSSENTNNNSDKNASSNPNVTVEELTGADVKPAPNLTTSPATENNKTENTKVTESAPGVSQTTNHTTSSENIVKFSVRSGENSAVVAANLYKAGLVKNPSDFDSFLEANGYDKNIRPGTYSIRTGSSNETIAKAITGN